MDDVRSQPAKSIAALSQLAHSTPILHIYTVGASLQISMVALLHGHAPMQHIRHLVTESPATP